MARPTAAGQPSARVGVADGASIAVETDPVGAAVSVDGLPCGPSPVTIERVGSGRHVLRIEGPPGSARAEIVDLRPGEALRLRVQLHFGDESNP
jgi:hypothetical protein